MRKYTDLITYLCLGCIVIGSLSLLFYLTQKNYDLLKQSNQAVILTGDLVKGHQQLSGDFKDALIYVSTLKNNIKSDYKDTYGTGMWQISLDLRKLDKLLDKNDRERKQLDSLSKLIDAEVSWMLSKSSDPRFSEQRDEHIKSLSTIQQFFDDEIARLQQISATRIKEAQTSLINLHNWIITIIITTSIIISITLLLIYIQFRRVKLQNKRLREIAWLQSHKVRAQVAILLGLGQLFNLSGPNDPDNEKVIAGMVETTRILDEIVHEINSKTDI